MEPQRFKTQSGSPIPRRNNDKVAQPPTTLKIIKAAAGRTPTPQSHAFTSRTTRTSTHADVDADARFDGKWEFGEIGKLGNDSVVTGTTKIYGEGSTTTRSLNGIITEGRSLTGGLPVYLAAKGCPKKKAADVGLAVLPYPPDYHGE